MAQPVWITQAGNIGIFPSGLALGISFIANPVPPAVTVTYKLLNGTFPIGTNSDPLVLSSSGILTGTPSEVPAQTEYTFTIRATDNFGNIKDRTFSMSVFGFNGVRITTPNGMLLDVFDSTLVDYYLNVNNPIPNNTYIIILTGGEIPPGLTLTTDGRIRGYAEPPVMPNGSPTQRVYNFTVQLTSQLGIDTKSYSIQVKNQQLYSAANTRKPAILNRNPLTLPVPLNDPYYSYYLLDSNIIPDINSGEYFSFKIIGHDFDNIGLTYNFSVLPPGLTGDTSTGWITGIPNIPPNSIIKYQFRVNVNKNNVTTILSDLITFEITVRNNIVPDIEWVTPANLGTINAGSISQLQLTATSSRDIEYRLIGGSLPPNVTLLDNGQIVGRFPYQPDSSTILGHTNSTIFNFTVRAVNPQFPVVENVRTFTLTLYQEYVKPTENIYMKACPNVSGRAIINDLLTDTSLIPDEYLYRPNDVFFGKATEIRYVHIYGMEPYTAEQYIQTMNINHYNRKLVLGEIKTAIARDSDNNIIYEVVYCDVIDNLVNPNGVSIQKEIIWPRDIPLDFGDYYVTSTAFYTSYTPIYVSYSPGYVSQRTLYPASLINMRTQIINNLTQNTSQELLPAWMTSQQTNGNTLGYIPAWVICYTKPGYSTTIKNNILNNWTHTLNEIDFSVDRYIIDRSGTFDYNTQLLDPQWTGTPSATPTPSPLNEYDVPVLFPRETILPTSNLLNN